MRKILTAKNPVEPRGGMGGAMMGEGGDDHAQFPVGDIDFLNEWNYQKLCEYREGLINSAASMEAQLARAQYQDDTKPKWVYSITFLHVKAKLMLDVVSKRLEFMESPSGALLRAAGDLYENDEVQELITLAAKYGKLTT